MFESYSTKPMKLGRAPTSGPFRCRADFRDAVVERFNRGWNVHRTAVRFEVSSHTVKALLIGEGLIEDRLIK